MILRKGLAMNRNLKQITQVGLGIAAVFCGTYFFIIPNQLGGYMNLGDGFILLFASLVHPLGGFLIGGMGSAIADIVSGFGLYAPFTLVIKGLEGFIVAKYCHKINRYVCYLIGCFIMISGYFLVDWFLQGSFAIAITGLPTNLMQALCGMTIAVLLQRIIRNVK